MHKCELCTILAPSLDSAITALEGGVGVALAATRDVVSEQLQGENLAKLSDSAVVEPVSGVRWSWEDGDLLQLCRFRTLTHDSSWFYSDSYL